MGLTRFTFERLLAPLRGLLHHLGAHPSRPAGRASAMRRSRPAALHMQAGRAHVAWAPARGSTARRQPLRVLRIVDACHAPSSAGRMVISGRMADVCAELDRLVALEGAGS